LMARLPPTLTLFTYTTLFRSMLELGQVADRLATESDIKGAILTGSGPKAFVAGADIGDLAKQGPFDGKARAQGGQGVLRRIGTRPEEHTPELQSPCKLGCRLL